MAISAAFPRTLAASRRPDQAWRLHLTLRRRMVLAYLCVAIVTGGIGACAVIGVVAIGHLTEQAFDGALISAGYVRAAAADFAKADAAMARPGYTEDVAHAAALLETVRARLQSLDGNLASAAGHATSPQALRAAAGVASAVDGWRAAVTTDSRTLDALALMVNDRLDVLVNIVAEDGFRIRQRIRSKAREARVFALLGTGAALALGALLAVLLSRQAVGPVAAAATEVSVLRQHSAALECANARLNAALNNMAQGLCLFSADDRLMFVNHRYCEIFGLLPVMPPVGTPLRDVVRLCADAGSLTDAEVEPIYERRMVEIAQRLASAHHLGLADGRVIAVVHQPMADGGWVATYEDVTERAQAEATISHMARHDTLTGLPNRIVLREVLDLAVAGLERGAAFGMLFLDLDQFKLVNDTLGFMAGDLVLRAVADRIVDCLRKTETVARLGADEFAVMVPGLHRPEDAGDVARRIIEAVGDPYTIEGKQVVIGASIGVVMAPVDGTTGDALLRKADVALYRAKQDGRGTICFFEPEMDARLQTRRAMETDLRAGLANSEFELLYQPLYDLQENRVCGFEALLRWNHAAGRISPGEFIPVAEDTGLIVPIGEWVLGQACAEAAGWPDRVKVAVNVSPVQFRSPFLVMVVQEALAQSGLDAARLELEVTESVLMTNSDATLAILHRLRALGVRISMDDFGTGFSSLSYLRSFPFDKIKIDQSFVRDLTADDGAGAGAGAGAIVGAIAGLGANLGIRTTAEGVETQEQLDRVRREGCTEVQGYLFSRPAPACEVQILIAQPMPQPLTPGQTGRALLV